MQDQEVLQVNKRYIPLEKRSKREQKAYFAAHRGSWGEVNPVTRKAPNPKAYNRRKSGQWNAHDPLPGIFSVEAGSAPVSLTFATVAEVSLLTVFRSFLGSGGLYLQWLPPPASNIASKYS